MKGFNPVFWLMWLLPGSAVVAGFATLGLALRGGDRPLPPEYHWEGARLDEDFERARRAAALGVEVTLEIAGGQCHASLRNVAGPGSLNLLLVHGFDAAFDRRVRLTRFSAGEYRAACAPLEPGKWRVAVGDDSTWSLRGSVDGQIAHLLPRAGSQEGGR